MEALSAAAHDDNPSSVKSDDSSPRRDSGSSSPPPNCAICLGTCKNKSFTDSCLHQFCFSCLLTWSKVKAECPLCKQAFRSIIHNVRSNHQYEEYLVVQRQNEESSSRIDIDSVTAATRRFRYRTTLTLPRRETIAIQQLLLHYPLMADVFPPPAAARRRRSPIAFRRTVYRHNLWARPLPDFTGRFRDCSPDFYRYNDTQMHRLVPWLNRELVYLLNENVGHISYVMSRILELLPQHHINSGEFREALQRYFGDRTEHFLHELYCFASTPYDMTGYDRNVQYTTDSRISTMVNEVISSSDSDATVDSDIVVMVSGSDPPEPPPGPSGLPAPVYPQNYISQPVNDSVIPIETISHSDTDDDSSEVMVVGYIKPPQERTPEVVDLLGSDSDVIVQDTPQPEPGAPGARAGVKLTLKRRRAGARSDSSDSCYTPPPRLRRRPPASPSPPASPASPASASSDLATPSPSPLADWGSDLLSRASTSTSPSPSPSPSSGSSTTASSDSSGDESVERRPRPTEKKSKRRTNKAGGSSRDRRRTRKRSSRSNRRHKKSLHGSSERDKRSKRKSHSGKGVKSSKKIREAPAPATEPAGRAGPSGVERPVPSGAERAGTSGVERAGTSGAELMGSGTISAERNGTSVADRAGTSRAERAGTTSAERAGTSRAERAGTTSAERAGTSRAERAGTTSAERAGTSSRRRKAGEQRRRRDSRETRLKRLRSVVNVMYNNQNTVESGSNGNQNNLVNNPSNTDNELTAGVSDSRVPKTECASDPGEDHVIMRARPASSDSEDDLPLNLTLQKICPSYS